MDAVATLAATALRPDYVSAHLNLGGIHMKRGQFAEAASAYEEVVGIDSLSFRGHSRLADAYRRLGREQEARAHWEQARTLIHIPRSRS